MNKSHVDKMDVCRHMLPPPGDEVVGDCIREIRAMSEQITALHVALATSNKIISQQADEAKKISDLLDLARDMNGQRFGEYCVRENQLGCKIADLEVEVRRRQIAWEQKLDKLPEFEAVRLLMIGEDLAR